MAQYDFGTIDPNTKSGTALATDLNSWRNALHSTHGGSSAPSYITAGMLWVDTTSADYELKLYDGAQSIPVAVIDATNNVARVAVDPAETSYITSTTSGQIRHVIASTNIFTTRSTGIQFNLASPVISDSNNNELIAFTTTASAVNQLNIANSATGGAVQLSTVGSDTNINIALMPKGTGNVGIGTNAPTAALDVVGNGVFRTTGATQITLSDSDGGFAASKINVENGGRDFRIAAPQEIIFETVATERARIDSSGNLLVGMTSSSSAANGCRLLGIGSLTASRDGSNAAVFNRKTSDGSIVEFRRDDAVVGAIGSASANTFYVGGGDTTLTFFPTGDAIVPSGTDGIGRSGAIDLGNSGNRWDTIFATVGTINTSDRTEKQDIEELNDAERRVAVACKGLLRKYRLKSAVALKGEDARIHFGIIAQDLQDAFTAEGLDAGRYGMFINSTWTDEQTNEEKSLMGVRYSELLAFMIAVL